MWLPLVPLISLRRQSKGDGPSKCLAQAPEERTLTGPVLVRHQALIHLFEPRDAKLSSNICLHGGGGLVTKSCLVTPWTVARQAPLSMRFPKQGYWSGLPFPPQGIFLTQESSPGLSPALQVDYLLTGSPGKPFGTHLVLA